MKSILLLLILTPYIQLFAGDSDTLKEPATVISINTEADFCSSYIYKGLILSNTYVFQPGVTASYGNLSTGLWCNINSPGSERSAELSELDIYVSYDLSFGRLSLANTAAMYIYTDGSGYPTSAVYILRADYPAARIGLFTEFEIDVMSYPGAFVMIHGLSYEHELSSRVYFNAALGLTWANSSYNEANTGLKKTSFDYASLDLSFTYYPTSAFYIKPHFQFNKVIDKELQEYIVKESSFFGILTGFTF